MVALGQLSCFDEKFVVTYAHTSLRMSDKPLAKPARYSPGVIAVVGRGLSPPRLRQPGEIRCEELGTDSQANAIARLAIAAG